MNTKQENSAKDRKEKVMEVIMNYSEYSELYGEDIIWEGRYRKLAEQIHALYEPTDAEDATVEEIKLKWQEHNRDHGLSWNEVAELVNEVAALSQPKEKLSEDEISCRNCHRHPDNVKIHTIPRCYAGYNLKVKPELCAGYLPINKLNE